MAVGGDIQEIRFSHPDIGDGVFYPKAAEDNTYDPGGVRTADDANMIDGGGNPIYQMNMVRGGFEAVVSNDQNKTPDDADVAARLAASPVPATWTFSVINGAVFRGIGKIVGDIQPNINQATFTLKVGGGQFRKI